MSMHGGTRSPRPSGQQRAAGKALEVNRKVDKKGKATRKGHSQKGAGKGKGVMDRQVQYPPTICDWCGHYGHTEDVCRKKQREETGCGRCGAVGHTPADCQHYLSVCELCGKTGHLAKVCRSAPAHNAKAAPAVSQDAQKPIPGLDPNGWRCNKGTCHAFNTAAQKNCGVCNKARPADDVAKDANPFGVLLNRAGTEVVERVNLATDTVSTSYPLSAEDQEIKAKAAALKRHIAAAKVDGLDSSHYEEQLSKLKIPDETIKP